MYEAYAIFDIAAKLPLDIAVVAKQGPFRITLMFIFKL